MNALSQKTFKQWNHRCGNHKANHLLKHSDVLFNLSDIGFGSNAIRSHHLRNHDRHSTLSTMELAKESFDYQRSNPCEQGAEHPFQHGQVRPNRRKRNFQVLLRNKLILGFSNSTDNSLSLDSTEPSRLQPVTQFQRINRNGSHCQPQKPFTNLLIIADRGAA